MAFVAASRNAEQVCLPVPKAGATVERRHSVLISECRLAYNWVMVDQELSLFHDTAPMLSITDLRCPLPSPELLWQSPNAERWLAATQSDRKSTRLNSSHSGESRMPSSA